MNKKQCTKCQSVFPATLDYFYKNSGGKYGVTPRCKSCVNEDNKANHEKRLKENPEKIREQANSRSKKHYHNNLDKARETSRESARRTRNDPEKYAVIRARKRAGGAGLSPAQIEQIRLAQDDKCKICQEPHPTDLDHCHKSGQVRWLLCRHCNRGLGAFRDNPEWLRKAAMLIETQGEHL